MPQNRVIPEDQDLENHKSHTQNNFSNEEWFFKKFSVKDEPVEITAYIYATCTSPLLCEATTKNPGSIHMYA
jgi:hypothetical protein